MNGWRITGRIVGFIAFTMISMNSHSGDGVVAAVISGLFWWAIFEAIGSFVDRKRHDHGWPPR